MGERKQPKILRWFLLWVLLTGLGLIGILISSTVVVGLTLSGSGKVDVNPSARFTVEHGEFFGLRTDSVKVIACTVRPDAGEPKDLLVKHHGQLNLRRASYSGTSERAWFSGGATVTCAAASTLDLPEVFRRGDTLFAVCYGLMTAGAASLVFGLFRLWRRGRAAKR